MIKSTAIGRVSMLILAVFISLSSAAALLADEPTSQPSQTPAATYTRHRRGPAFVLDRIRQAVGKLDLTDDQKTKVNAIFDQAAQKINEMYQNFQTEPRAQRTQALRELTESVRQQLAGVLTPDQMDSLRQSLRPTGSGAAGGAGPLESMQNLRQAISKLDLSDDQRQQVDDAIRAATEKNASLREQAADGADVQAQLGQNRQDLRNKLQSILTPDQWQSLAESMMQSRQDASDDETSAPKAAATPQASDETTTSQPLTPALSVGAAVPKVKIVELNGRSFMPSNYKGHVLVLEFGSMSCPVFRHQVKAMEDLKSAEGPRAFFMVVYTREQFPEGGCDVQRNKDENISVPQATTLEQRRQQAQQAQASLGITMPMGIDSMDNSVSNAFGTFPNGAVVIGKDGKIAAVEQWCNPDSLRHEIDAAYDDVVVPSSSSSN